MKRLLATTASSTTSVRRGREPAHRPPSCPGAFPTPTWDALRQLNLSLISTAAAWYPPIVTGGYWALGDRGYSPFQGGTNVFRSASSLELIRRKHNIRVGIDFRANQMNVGTEAFQDGYWIIGNGGNFTGYTCPSSAPAASPSQAIPRRILTGITGLANPRPDLRCRRHRPPLENLPALRRGRLANRTSLTLNLGVAWDMTTPSAKTTAGSPTTFLRRPGADCQ